MGGGHIREDIGMAVALYAGSQRSSSTADGRVTRHSFSFGPHYDPANLGFGPLVCHNDDVLDPSGVEVAGYPDHPHSELEIVTWVLEGALVHTDSTGARHVVEAGHAQVLSAGTGIRHSEVADAGLGGREPGLDEPAATRRTSWARRRRRPGWSTWRAGPACPSA